MLLLMSFLEVLLGKFSTLYFFFLRRRKGFEKIQSILRGAKKGKELNMKNYVWYLMRKGNQSHHLMYNEPVIILFLFKKPQASHILLLIEGEKQGFINLFFPDCFCLYKNYIYILSVEIFNINRIL